MSRTYPLSQSALRPTGIALVTLAMSLGLSTSLPARQTGTNSIFDSKPLDQQRFAVLAQPIGHNDWKLLVLEQIRNKPRCWTPRSDGLIDPSLNKFNFAGICSRYLDSNGYSLRGGKQDMPSAFRLRIQQSHQELRLLAMDPNRSTTIPVGRGKIPRRDRNGFVKLSLEPGWALERRVYQGRTLSHVYFANPAPVNALLAKASASPAIHGQPNLGFIGQPTAPPPRPGAPSRGINISQSGGPIRIEVIPFRP
ncbi:MAG: DUF3747 domain-containing protein [Prochlorococcus sp.]